MTAERWGRIKAIFDSALEEAAEDRPSFVEQACAGDEGMLREVLGLIREHETVERTETFLNEPIAYLSYSLAAGEAIGGRYRVVRLLGRGGMGEVYEVRDQLLDEAAALKTLRADLSFDPGLVRRFQTEIQLARRVTHPNVCRVYEVGVHEFEDSGRPPLHFFTMQLLEGETLAARIRRTGRLAKREAFPLVTQMAEGLAAAHAVGIIHRDFKSANVMLADGRAVITDFGLAGLEEERVATAGAAAGAATVSMGAKLAGTVPYMSPEQLSGAAVGLASDIYSLGVVLFEMATGQLPFDDRHIINSAMQRVRRETPAVRGLAPDIDARWEAAIRRCLEVEPERRFGSAAEVAAVFAEERWRLPRVYWTRRQYALATASAAIPLALGGTWWVWSRRPYRAKPEAARWYERGVEALRAATYEAARRDLEQAVAMDGRYAPAYADLAAAYGELDQSERAKELMLQAVSMAQDERLSERDATRVKAMEYVIARDFDKARPMFERLLAIAPAEEKAGAYVDLAWLALKREDNPGMIPPLEAALKLDSGNAGAKLRLAMAMDRQGKRDAAQKLFGEAEALFDTASNYDGEVETLLQRGISLAKAKTTAEAVPLIRRGMDLAVSTGDVQHQIRLELALALTYQNKGDFTASKEAAERAVKAAQEKRMDATAAGGLVDLGNSYFLRGEPGPVEQYFQQALELARRGRALPLEARAQAALGSFYTQYGSAANALKYVESALAFFRGAGYQRESMQTLLILGGIQDTAAQLDDAEKNLREAVALADRIHDTEQSGLTRLYLGTVLEELGKWPQAVGARNEALSIFGDMRGGLRAAYALAFRGGIWAELGRFQEAEADFSKARLQLGRLEGPQEQLRAQLTFDEAQMAYYRRQWSRSLELARSAQVRRDGGSERLWAEALAGVSAVRLGRIAEGVAECHDAIRKGEQEGPPYLVAMAKVALAAALKFRGKADSAGSLAREALPFFEQRRIWEVVWQCYSILAGPAESVEERKLAEAAIDELKRQWPAEMLSSYFSRPDLKEMVLR